MDFSLIVILWIAFMVFEKVANKKKKTPPTQPAEKNGNENFDIPTLANDPNFPGEEVTIFQDEIKPAEVRNFKQNVAEKNFQQDFDNKFENPHEIKNLNLTAESAMHAVILSEILGKPKALQRK